MNNKVLTISLGSILTTNSGWRKYAKCSDAKCNQCLEEKKRNKFLLGRIVVDNLSRTK